ncbi:MAG: lipopolysaccharide biosynthesis regulator YciM [Granulosicoccus sp.]
MSIPDLLWLLLPIAAAAGWIAAKRSDARKTRAFWDYTSEFHQGLNVLLSDKQATPVDLFHNATSADRNTAETHIALGNHYRQRGDMERAVFMHQSVLDNEELDEEVRAAARFELARDYDSAGLLDRSEAEFKELIKSEHRISDAYQSLLQLHERESDWDQAIKVALDAERNTESHVGRKIAHYYCELASESIKQGASEMASTQLAKALEHDVTCARASMMLAELALEAKHFSQASTLYERVEALRPELMPEIIDRRFDVLRQAGDDAEFDRFLRRIHSQRNAYSVIRSTRAVIAQRHNPQLADRFFKDQILKRPSLKGLRDWAHDQVELSKPDEREKVQVICDLLDKVVEDKPAYRCNQCGFQGNVMHWRCPSCEQWDSVSTIIGVEGE